MCAKRENLDEHVPRRVRKELTCDDHAVTTCALRAKDPGDGGAMCAVSDCTELLRPPLPDYEAIVTPDTRIDFAECRVDAVRSTVLPAGSKDAAHDAGGAVDGVIDWRVGTKNCVGL